MPNIESAKKALRQSQKRRKDNLRRKRLIKNTLKDYNKFVVSGDIDSAKQQLVSVYKILDKAAKRGLIKKNKAGRLKSRLTLKLNRYQLKSNPES